MAALRVDERRSARAAGRGAAAVAVVVAAAALLLTSRRCAAADGDGAARPEPSQPSVEMSCLGPELACDQLGAVVDLLLHGDPRVVWTLPSPAAGAARSSPEDPASAGISRVQIDATGAGVVRVITLRPGAPPEARAVDAPVLNLVTTEVVAQIVRATALALLADAPAAAVSRGPAPDAETAAPAVPPVPAVAPTPIETPAAPSPPLRPEPAAPGLALSTPAGARPSVPLRRAIAFSAGYLVRSVFHSGTAIGESQPLAQGVATSVSLFPAWSWWRMRPYASLSLEYARVVGRTEVEIGFPVSSTYQETVTGIGGALMAGVVVRPIRFIELGAGVGAGAIEHQKDGAASSPATWRPVARGLVSVAAVGLPLGLEVTAALTLDHRFGDPYDTQVIASFPAPTFAEERVDQPGGLITLGWRR